MSQGSGIQGSRLACSTPGLTPEAARDAGITKVTVFDSRTAQPEHGNCLGRSVATHESHAACSLHTHRGATEQFFVLGGQGRIVVGKEKFLVATGDNVFIPVGVPHQVVAFRFGLVLLCDLTRAPGHEDDTTPWAAVA